MLTVQCPKCGQTLRLLERHLGVKGKCLKCAEPIIAERDDDSDEIEVLLLTQHREKQAVVTPIESARAEWTPFEMAANETGTFPVMNTNDPSSVPAVSPFGDLDSHDSKEPMSGKIESKASDESKEATPKSESAAANPKPLGGFSGALFSQGSLPPSIDAAAADVHAESPAKEEGSSSAATQPKSARPPLPGIAGMASFPFPSKQENKANAEPAESPDEEVPEPRFSNAIDPEEDRGDKSKAVPWMNLLAGKADTESTAGPDDDASTKTAAGAVDEAVKAVEPGVEAVAAIKAGEIGKENDKAEAGVEEKGKSAAAPEGGNESATADGDDGASRTKLNWAAGLKSGSNKIPSIGAIGVSAKTDANVEPKADKEAEPEVATDTASAPAAGKEQAAQAEGEKDMGFDYFSSRDNDASSKANKDAPEPEAVTPDESEAKAAEAPKAKSKSDGAIEGADPSVTTVPKINKIRERRKRRKVRRMIGAFLFLMILAAGIASLMYFKPAFRSKQVQPALMAAYDKAKGQLTDSEKKFDIHTIIAPIKDLWTQGSEPAADDSIDANVIAADETTATESTEPKPVTDAAENTLAVADAPPSGGAGGDSGAPAVADVAVATSPGSGPAASVDTTAVGGGSPTGDVELTRAGPGEDEETRRVRTEGEAMLKQFYAARSAEGKLAYVLDPGSVATSIEDAFPSPVEIPSIRSMAFKGRLVDSSTKRVFGVFDVRENENGDRHRWCVPEIAPDQFKVDWELYQQLLDDELTRFLATPGANPETFRLLIRRGPTMAETERPWNEDTLEMHLLMPLDDGKPSRVLMTRSTHDELGFDSDLADGAARVGQVQLGWKESDTEPGLKVPTITAFERWGAWE